MAFEKDKKDQSKCYLSYPKPPVLDMKWENCGKHSKVSSSTKWGLGKNVDGMLNSKWLVLIHLWITILHFSSAYPQKFIFKNNNKSVPLLQPEHEFCQQSGP